jgi:peptidoglycan-associated lipoprotein
MSRKCWSYGVLVLMCAGVVLSGGCRTKKPIAGSDVIGPETPMPPVSEVAGEQKLPARIEDGTRVTDVSFENVLFQYDSYQIDGAEMAKVEKVAEYMKATPAVRLVAEGNCDERGSREYNMSLGEHRAQAVRAQLISLGVDGARIQTKSYGKEKPLDPGHSEGAWNKNRRVEFPLYR